MADEKRDYHRFAWEDLGDLDKGRPNLGTAVPVLVYRLLQSTLRDVLIAELGPKKADELFIRAGRLAGEQFCMNLLHRDAAFPEFAAQFQRVLKEQAIGILRFEEADLLNMQFTLTVAEDLDCSGLPCTDEVVCKYDEGFLAGVLEAYTGKPFSAREIDCWASGDRVCRFAVKEST
jgi:hypothetical protein